MSVENVELMRRFWSAFNTGDIDGLDEICSPDFVNHDPGFPTTDADLRTTKQYVRDLLAAFPDMKSTEEDVMSSDDQIAVRRTLRGTHRHDFMGVEASDRAIEVGGIWLAHIERGQYNEQWVYFDAVGLLRQIGALPSPD